MNVNAKESPLLRRTRELFPEYDRELDGLRSSLHKVAAMAQTHADTPSIATLKRQARIIAAEAAFVLEQVGALENMEMLAARRKEASGS